MIVGPVEPEADPVAVMGSPGILSSFPPRGSVAWVPVRHMR